MEHSFAETVGNRGCIFQQIQRNNTRERIILRNGLSSNRNTSLQFQQVQIIGERKRLADIGCFGRKGDWVG